MDERPRIRPDSFDVCVVGAGLVGLATAHALMRRGRSVVVLEAEADVARHQSGRNSGVVHAGLYYQPGSLKARLCAEGREALLRFAAEQGIAHERCGKLVVATSAEELPRLDELERRAAANGLGVERLRGGVEIRAREPHAAGVEGLLVPETGIVDFPAVARALARSAGELRTGWRVTAIEPANGGVLVRCGKAGEAIAARHLVNCAGLQSDRVARLAGLRPPVRILPFRGEYFDLARERRSLVRHLIYPVPDPRFPFLGVHLTRRVDGGVEAGPNAVLAWRREGYRRGSFSARDTLSTLTFPGFWRLAARFWRTGLAESRRSGNRSRFAASLSPLVPEIAAADLEPGGSGVRAQAVDRNGRLVDDFAILDGPAMTHVLNAPSPGATACLAIGEEIARRVSVALVPR